LVIDALQDVVQFIKRSDIDPFTIAVLSHAQFETIHPFADGNGRTGRALVHAILHGSKLTSHSTLPISAGLLHDIDLYFAALMSYREGDIRPIMEAFVNATFHALTNSKALVEELRQIRSRWSDTLPVRNGSNTLRLLDVLVRIPVLNAQIVCEELEIGPNNVGRIVQPLVDANILLESTGRQRGQVWRSPDVLNALDAFAARAGRRN
jgi:Fic family protein